MDFHRDRRATPLCAKSRPQRSGRPERAAGRVACLRVASATRLRCAPRQRPAPGDHDHYRYWVQALARSGVRVIRPKRMWSGASASCTAISNFSRNSAATIRARAGRDAGFKACCLDSGRFRRRRAPWILSL